MRLILLPLLLTPLLAAAEPDTILRNTDMEPERIAEVQVLLARQGFGCGLMDNRTGPRTRAALADFMAARGMATEADALALLRRDTRPIVGLYAIRPSDLAALGQAPRDWEAASRVPSMAYESLPELLAETFCLSERYLQALNPSLDWSAATAGVRVAVLNWQPPPPVEAADRVEIDPAAFRLRLLDTNGVIRLSFPCSVARDRTRIPVGELAMAVFAPNPDYTFDPANYPDNPRAREIGRRLILPPGPNNPVGVYWIGLNRPGFGIHGTPRPETIGSMESGGCFRLINRDVLTVSRHVRPGMAVSIIGTTGSADHRKGETP